MTACQVEISAPFSDTPCGVIMKVSQALAINMMQVPTTLSMTPRNRCTFGENFPQP